MSVGHQKRRTPRSKCEAPPARDEARNKEASPISLPQRSVSHTFKGRVTTKIGAVPWTDVSTARENVDVWETARATRLRAPGWQRAAAWQRGGGLLRGSRRP